MTTKLIRAYELRVGDTILISGIPFKVLHIKDGKFNLRNFGSHGPEIGCKSQQKVEVIINK